MEVSLPIAVANRLLAMESNPTPLSEFSIAAELEALIPHKSEYEIAVRRGCFAEIEGLRFGSAFHHGRHPWGIYFIPIWSGVRGDGADVFRPDALEADTDVVAYWTSRSERCAHPVLRARYADLAREIGGLLNKQKEGQPRIELPLALAHRAADSYVAAVEQGLVASEDQAWRFLDRALELALQIKDRARVENTKAAAWSYHRQLRCSGTIGRWWMIDNLFWDRKGLALEPSERAELIGWLDEVLARSIDTGEKSSFDPHQAGDAAERLRRWHGASRRDKGIAAIKAAGQAFEFVAAMAEPTLAASWLEDLSARYRASHLDADAARVDLAIMSRSEEPRPQVQSDSVRGTSAQDKLRLDELTAGSAEEAMTRIAIIMMAPPDQVRELVDRDAASSPLMAMVDIKIEGPSGLTTAIVGSAEADPHGRVVFLAARIIEARSPELERALRRALERCRIGVDEVLAFVGRCPAFAPKAKPLLRAGLEAWHGGDPLKAIHVLVPQVEAALRAMLVARGESPMRSKADGAFESMGMGALLATDAFKTSVDPALRLHLRALYSDARGLNLRNHLAHGLAGPELLGAAMANWVVHTILAISVLESSSIA